MVLVNFTSQKILAMFEKPSVLLYTTAPVYIIYLVYKVLEKRCGELAYRFVL